MLPRRGDRSVKSVLSVSFAFSLVFSSLGDFLFFLSDFLFLLILAFGVIFFWVFLARVVFFF